MTYEEIVAKVSKHYQAYKPANAQDRVAIQFDITGEGEGAFYLEIAEGKIEVEPYEYYEHDIKVTATADALLEVVDGKTDLINANLTGRIHAEGDLQKAEILNGLEKKTTRRTSAAKKTADEKPAAKKTTAAKKSTGTRKTASKKTAK